MTSTGQNNLDLLADSYQTSLNAHVDAGMNDSTLLPKAMMQVCHQMYSQQFVHARAGNISVRFNESEICISPTGWSLSEMTPEHFVWLDIVGQPKQDKKQQTFLPTSEWKIHQAIYQANPDIKAILHAHPPYATAFCLVGESLQTPYLGEIIMTLGEVPLIDYYLPGSDALAKAVSDALNRSKAVLMANHGVIVTGHSLKDAYYNLELLESTAKTLFLARQLGPLRPLSSTQVQEIHETLTRNYKTH
jgi:L-fuculose-phosphate aldolase